MFHPLQLSTDDLPHTFNNPFHYTPSKVCRKAADIVQQWIQTAPKNFQQEVAAGKMFGVLVVSYQQQIGFLAGYSGQICGRSDWQGYVPAVVDYLQPNAYFKQNEAGITALSQQITLLEHHPRYLQSRTLLQQIKAEGEKEIKAFQQQIKAEKSQRPSVLTPELIARSQFLKAELHRLKKRIATAIDQQTSVVNTFERKLAYLKSLRKNQSDALQRWLFERFSMINGRGECRNLLQIFAPKTPPAGSGECCEPRLLQYAFQHEMRPISMAMFWWGRSPKEEIRHHLAFYPACNGKCKPILNWMLQGIKVANDTIYRPLSEPLKILYHDEAIAVVYKPAGMLSVPGKEVKESVLTSLQKAFPKAEGPIIVHRLDMATSGVMVAALTTVAYHHLQTQFAHHTIKKQYVALLSQPFKGATEGEINLPLRPDLVDRPRQVVDFVHGKQAISRYHYLGNQRILLFPLTGRTHQLRMHCAHQQGLNNPILGDMLYASPSLVLQKQPSRLYLHAEKITFIHPLTQQEMTFSQAAPF